VLLPGLLSLVNREADGLSTTAKRKPLELVLLELTPLGVKTHVILSWSPVPARVTGFVSVVK
jgi:hypothetical protein